MRDFHIVVQLLEEVGDQHLKGFGDARKPAAPDAVLPLLVFLDLLKRDPELLSGRRLSRRDGKRSAVPLVTLAETPRPGPVLIRESQCAKQAMADQSAKERLIRFLDRKAFLPVIDAKPDDYPESQRDKLMHVKRATQSERERFRGYGSAQDVVTNFKRDLHSDAAEEVHRELRDLGLPTINDVRNEFEKLARGLGVAH